MAASVAAEFQAWHLYSLLSKGQHVTLHHHWGQWYRYFHMLFVFPACVSFYILQCGATRFVNEKSATQHTTQRGSRKEAEATAARKGRR